MYKNASVLLIVLSVLTPFSVQAEIYRWTDSDGKLHYGDKSKQKKSGDDELVVIKDKYTIPKIASETPITHNFDGPSHTVEIVGFDLELRRSEDEDVRIGREVCLAPVDLYWTDGHVELESQGLGSGVEKAFEGSGYQFSNSIGSTANPSSLRLVANIKNLKLNLCSKHKNRRKSQKTKNASFVEVEWLLYRPQSEDVVYRVSTKGSHDALGRASVKDGLNKSLNAAVYMAANNLLSNESFVSHLEPVDLSSLKASFDQVVEIGFSVSDSGSFQRKVKHLKDNSVTIKTKGGHGSGVIVSDEGYILTNAHVVGDETEFEVTNSEYNFTAKLVRKEAVRDVALLKISGTTRGLTGVSVSESVPEVGSSIFVIGTPLKVQYDHTITKGIVSAKRNMEGLNYYQTDASINFGNSGGPVFDEKGNLVALTVAGLFNKNGASLNLNYLIPVEDVYTFLNVTPAATSREALRGMASDASRLLNDYQVNVGEGFIVRAVDFVYAWLDSPLVPE